LQGFALETDFQSVDTLAKAMKILDIK